MKVYYFTIIAVGLMFLMGTMHIETVSHKIMTTIGDLDWNSGFLWAALLIAILAFIASTNRISIFGSTIQVSTEAIVAAFVLAVYSVFAMDIFSIVSFVYSKTHDIAGNLIENGWIYYMVWALIVPLMAGYTIALIEFIRGND